MSDKDDTYRQTQMHINTVRKLLSVISENLRIRGNEHDASKLENPEFDTFCLYTKKLAGMTYGSDEYKQCLSEMKPALDHHYANNRHHPEHFPKGIDDMHLIDLIEMFCDWKAATLRHNDGNIVKSIEHNSKRFNMSEQLVRVLMNSIDLF
jgi:hypothetical protein